MATTTNFGWTTPDDTDLVKDGAAAIRTLGSAIDTSLVDLKGGTTGQVLSKASNTDMDFTWVAQDDSNAIQNAIIDAKGDLIVGTAADTPARLAVGTDGYYLQADSAEASGVKWVAPAASSFVGCRATITVGQSITNSATSVVDFNNEDFDTDAFHDNSTNPSRLTIPTGKGGKYRLESSIVFSADADDLVVYYIYKNGSAIAQRRGRVRAGFYSAIIHTILDLAAGDYIQFYIYQEYSTGATQNIEPDVGSVPCSWASIEYLGV